MASGDLFDYVEAPRFSRSNGSVSDLLLRANGRVAGVPLGGDGDYSALSNVWANGTPLPTGLTIKLDLVDDPENSGAGKVVALGVSAKPVVSGTDDLTAPLSANEVVVTATMSATAGKVTRASVALPNSKLNSLAAGGLVMLRVRRLKSNSSDTHPGRALLIGAAVSDT